MYRVSDRVDGPTGWVVRSIGDAVTHYTQYIYPGFPCDPFPGKPGLPQGIKKH